MLVERYFETTKWIRNPMDELERQKLEGFMLFFKEYGDQYGFDWLAIVAQAYQESGLDHNSQSRAGAVGIMQLLPSTAEYVGFPDVTGIENNIHAGVKYLSYLRERYFSDPELEAIDRFAFTWAAYNAGPTKVRKMRARAEKMELDPNKWFQNVEYAALRIVGQETVKYVANIYKYYIAYALSRELLNEKAVQLQAMEASGAK
jgi:membrane-bound lytic murein transglycosylase MltF